MAGYLALPQRRRAGCRISLYRVSNQPFKRPDEGNPIQDGLTRTVLPYREVGLTDFFCGLGYIDEQLLGLRCPLFISSKNSRMIQMADVLVGLYRWNAEGPTAGFNNLSRSSFSSDTGCRLIQILKNFLRSHRPFTIRRTVFGSMGNARSSAPLAHDASCWLSPHVHWATIEGLRDARCVAIPVEDNWEKSPLLLQA